MKNLFYLSIKTFFISIIFGLWFIGSVYLVLAWTDGSRDLNTVTTSDTLTASRWNDVIARVTHIFRDTDTLIIDGWISVWNSNSTKLGTIKWDGTDLKVYKSWWWQKISTINDYGLVQTNPWWSCKDILTQNSDRSGMDGTYWIKPTWYGSAFQVYCDMSTIWVTKPVSCAIQKNSTNRGLSISQQADGDCRLTVTHNGYSYVGNVGWSDDHEICQMVLQYDEARNVDYNSTWYEWWMECSCATNCNTKDVTWTCNGPQNTNTEDYVDCDLSWFDI